MLKIYYVFLKFCKNGCLIFSRSRKYICRKKIPNTIVNSNISLISPFVNNLIYLLDYMNYHTVTLKSSKKVFYKLSNNF